MMGGDQSLNATVSPTGEDAWQDFLADDRPSPEENVTLTHDSRQRSRWLAASLAELSDREQTIIRERRLREDGRTLEELGVRLGSARSGCARSSIGRCRSSGWPWCAGSATRSSWICSPRSPPEPTSVPLDGRL